MVWNGTLCKTVSLDAATLEEQVDAALDAVRDWENDHGANAGQSGAAPFIAVPQSELDLLLAVRRWFYQRTHTEGLASRIHGGPGNA